MAMARQPQRSWPPRPGSWALGNGMVGWPLEASKIQAARFIRVRAFAGVVAAPAGRVLVCVQPVFMDAILRSHGRRGDERRC